MTEPGDRSMGTPLAGPGLMLLSAALFGYFGFFMTWIHHSQQTGQFLLFVALLDWTLKVSAIVFLLAALIAFANRILGNLVYAVCGLGGAVLFIVVAVLDYLDTQHTAISPLILLLFAAWNGFGSWTALKAILALQAARPPWESPE